MSATGNDIVYDGGRRGPGDGGSEDSGRHPQRESAHASANTDGAVTFNIGTTGTGTTITPTTGDRGRSISCCPTAPARCRWIRSRTSSIHLGSGGDTVNVTTPLGGTTLSTTTITVEGGAGGDTVNAGAMTGDHHIVFNGAGGDD